MPHESEQAGIDNALEFIWNLINDYTDEPCAVLFAEKKGKVHQKDIADQNDIDRFADESPAAR